MLEKAPTLGEIGAGIQLGPNAFHCFDRLGIGEAARGMAVFIDRLRLMDAQSAEEITSIPLDAPFRARFGNPYAVVHRGDLHRVFLNACKAYPHISLRTASEAVSYEQDGSRVSVQLRSGERVTGAALIGADGLWSNIRKQLAGDGPPRISGHSTYRSVIETARMPEDLRWNAATLWAGPKCHIVHYPLSDWRVFNLVVTYHNQAAEPVAGRPCAQEEVMQGFTHVHPRAQEIIRCGTGLEALGSVRSRTAGQLGGRPRGAPGRCGTPNAAILGTRCLHGHGRRCGVGGRESMRSPICRARCTRISSGVFCAPRACSCSPAQSASISTIRPAHTQHCATQ